MLLLLLLVSALRRYANICAQAHWRLQTLALKIIILGQVTLVQKLRPRGHGFNQNNAFVLD